MEKAFCPLPREWRARCDWDPLIGRQGGIEPLQSGIETAAMMLAATWAALLGMGCGDPVRDDATAALGPENPGVQEGPLHRPGQPCVLCHSDEGGAPPFTLGGTIYIVGDSPRPADGIDVLIVDRDNVTFRAVSNCAGNFFVRTEEFTPDYPIWLTLRGGNVTRDMDSPVYREGSCAACHRDRVGPDSSGRVYLIEDPTVEIPPRSQCP
jgi:mono/diheme cytochrome c family protein